MFYDTTTHSKAGFAINISAGPYNKQMRLVFADRPGNINGLVLALIYVRTCDVQTNKDMPYFLTKFMFGVKEEPRELAVMSHKNMNESK